MTHGMIVAPQPEAVEAGAVTLKRGGNAVDAAIACALVQGVVDPCMTGIAGFGTGYKLIKGQRNADKVSLAAKVSLNINSQKSLFIFKYQQGILLVHIAFIGNFLPAGCG